MKRKHSLKRKRTKVGKEPKTFYSTRAAAENSNLKIEWTFGVGNLPKYPGINPFNYPIYSAPEYYHSTPICSLVWLAFLKDTMIIHCMTPQTKRRSNYSYSHLLSSQPMLIKTTTIFLKHHLTRSKISSSSTPSPIYLSKVNPKRGNIPPLGNFLFRVYSLMEPHIRTSFPDLSPSQIFPLLDQTLPDSPCQFYVL